MMKDKLDIVQLGKIFLNKVIRKYIPLVESCLKVVIGEKLIKKYRKYYGKNTHFLFMRGATGDVYIQFMVMNNWIKENGITSYVIISGVPSINGIKELFSKVEYVVIRGYLADCIEKACMLLGEEYLRLKVLFPWTYSLYFNRCRVRMVERFHFMDTYRWYVLGLREKMYFAKPCFKKLKEEKIESMGVVKNRTIIISPEANSVTQLSIEFWNNIIDRLKEKGYKVFVNCKENEEYHAKTIFFPYCEGVPIIEHAGYFVGVRSGLCDILSSARCRKIIIYPKKALDVNYSEHRSEIEFCGLRVMGLVGEEDDLIEIETFLIRNITQNEYEIQEQKQKNEVMRLQDEILGNIL